MARIRNTEPMVHTSASLTHNPVCVEPQYLDTHASNYRRLVMMVNSYVYCNEFCEILQ